MRACKGPIGCLTLLLTRNSFLTEVQHLGLQDWSLPVINTVSRSDYHPRSTAALGYASALGYVVKSETLQLVERLEDPSKGTVDYVALRMSDCPKLGIRMCATDLYYIKPVSQHKPLK